ncbi:MAG TPA: pro-sigmaK processing inhibitor BofA family protein [Candidatus Fimadaptatus faecigallinarum]|uniref:Pro-sigmaK processing inhibitor BofA family protein n=1 Tax=Candidatus Fimadaptatus faecigallinarum TaxID=2840814 RepID=A0A9D1LPT2_9FIRM|nr:pro-sigmaK processing inhibitor BofA family protein [Candidatus Fimadaptatus faecigallinarum]
MAIPWELLLAYGVGLALLYMLGRLLLVPGKWLWRLVLNSLVGALLMWLVNLFSGLTGFTVAINPFTVLITGLLGIPGVLLNIGLTLLL